MTTSVLVLGAGFGGLELCSRVSAALGDEVEITLIDQADAFVFGFSKLDVLFGTRTLEEVRMPYEAMTTPHVRFRQETITAIDPSARRVTTDLDTYEADVLVVALGADYDLDATPGLVEHGNEFYSVAGAERLRDVLPSFTSGTAIVGVCGAPFKCPPAPSEAAILLDEFLRARGVRDDVHIQVVIPFGAPCRPRPRPRRRSSRTSPSAGSSSCPSTRSSPSSRGPPCSTTGGVFPATCSSGSRRTARPPWWRRRA